MAEIFTPAFWGEYGGILAEGVWEIGRASCRERVSRCV